MNTSSTIIALPGALWPADAGRQPYAGVQSATLAQILHKSIRQQEHALPRCWSSWLMHALTGVHADAPFAASSAQSLPSAQIDPASGTWLRVDPAHFEVGREDVALATPAAFTVTDDESAQFVCDLNAHFAADGVTFIALSNRQWIMHVPQALTLDTVDPWAAQNVPARFVPIQGADARALRRLMVETQMLLHAHPLNAAREARGVATVNGLFPWACGVLPAISAAHRAKTLMTTCKQAYALARALEIPAHLFDGAAPSAPKVHMSEIVGYFPNLMTSMLAGDDGKWRATMAADVERALAFCASASTTTTLTLGGQRPTHVVQSARPSTGIFSKMKSVFSRPPALAEQLHALAQHDA